MKYWVEVTETAWAEVENAYNWLAGQSPQAAMRWKKALLQAVDSLETMPDRCHLASGKYRVEKGKSGNSCMANAEGCIGFFSRLGAARFTLSGSDTAPDVCLRKNKKYTT